MLSPETSLYMTAAHEAVSDVRRKKGAPSIEDFGRAYLPHYFQLPGSRMHREVAQLLEKATTERGARIAVAAPRGHAKSSLVSLTLILWCVCYQLERFIVLFSDTGNQASDLLSHVKKELEGNRRLI